MANNTYSIEKQTQSDLHSPYSEFTENKSEAHSNAPLQSTRNPYHVILGLALVVLFLPIILGIVISFLNATI